MRSALSFLASAFSVLAFSGLALGLFASFTSASAAKEHHHRPRHAVLRHAYGYIDPPRFVAAPRVVVPPIIEDQTPSYNDPSKWGGGAP
jgi:hypothetical protein